MSCTLAVGNSAAIRSSFCLAFEYDSPLRSKSFGSPSSVEMEHRLCRDALSPTSITSKVFLAVRDARSAAYFLGIAHKRLPGSGQDDAVHLRIVVADAEQLSAGDNGILARLVPAESSRAAPGRLPKPPLLATPCALNASARSSACCTSTVNAMVRRSVGVLVPLLDDDGVPLWSVDSLLQVVLRELAGRAPLPVQFAWPLTRMPRMSHSHPSAMPFWMPMSNTMASNRSRNPCPSARFGVAVMPRNSIPSGLGSSRPKCS